MTKNDLIRLRSKIVATLADLEITAASARSVLKESSEVIPNFLQDESDAAKGELDLGNTLRVHNHSTAQQRILRQALDRMESGTYGLCQECGDSIGLPRLMAMPGAPLCIHCQQTHEFGFASDPQIPKSANHVPVRWAA
jgi:DnaK suppressor protein